MHAIAWRTVCARHRISAPGACRIIAGVRRPLPPSTSRNFHRSPVAYRNPPETPSTPSNNTGTPIDSQGKNVDKGNNESQDSESKAEQPVAEGEQSAEAAGDGKAQSNVNRSTRNWKTSGVPALVLPDWFPERNILLFGESGTLNNIIVPDARKPAYEQDIKHPEEVETSEVKNNTGTEDGVADPDKPKEESTESGESTSAATESEKSPLSTTPFTDQEVGRGGHDSKSASSGKPSDTFFTPTIPPAAFENRCSVSEKQTGGTFAALFGAPWKNDRPGISFRLDNFQINEILTSLNAGLVLPAPPDVELKDLHRPTTMLFCPRDGGIMFLDDVVEQSARALNADLLRLDAQDLAEIIGNYCGENIAWSAKRSTTLLAYRAHDFSGRTEVVDNGPRTTDSAEKPVEDDEYDLDRPPRARSATKPKLGQKDAAAKLKEHMGTLRTLGVKVFFDPQPLSALGVDSHSTSKNEVSWVDLKINTALEALLDSVSKKRRESPEKTSTGQNSVEGESHGLIVHIRDYREIMSTSVGINIINKLEDIITKRWHGGERIILVGTSSSDIPDYSTAQIRSLQDSRSSCKYRSIVVTPKRDCMKTEDFNEDDRAYFRTINIRHVRDMITKLSGIPCENFQLDLGPKIFELADTQRNLVEDSVWPMRVVYRIATNMIGDANLWSDSSVGTRPKPGSPLSLPDESKFDGALGTVAFGDESRFEWAKEEEKLIEEADKDQGFQKDIQDKNSGVQTKDRIKQLKEKCNFHEKKLLSGVVFPADIHTTFSDVRTPPETVEALKTLTSLSLVRPEAFKYGVLATDKIPGLLLYGPPGTGKTMLAKAVAKESGATVLDLSGADLFNLYVGEGEKNVRALFSLAKKLTPCVVFIDEADAIFGSRSGDSAKRTTHRELINQFLREWDGMKDMSAFIMVATNRPFDLDDAVLRRLPRRILVDLPTEKDRESILGIHLKNEVLDDTVSLSKIASDTPYYSGSDLKNLSVAAALACVREENEAAAKHTGPEKYVYPPKRTLSKRHFDKALEEISASISEDMSTLKGIRKFDEKYGDRRGRRKKSAALGFGGIVETERDSEKGRVRKIEDVA